MSNPRAGRPGRGRDLFGRYRLLLRLLSGMVRVVPRPLSLLAWRTTDILPGILGVGVRYCIVRALSASCGDNVFVGPDVEVIAWERLELGHNVSIHRGCYLDASGGIVIGSDVSIAHQSSLVSFNHTWADHSRPIRDNPCEFAAICVGDDVWIGCGCRVLAGVSIGKRSVIGAGAVVAADVAPGTVAGGVPARPIGRTRTSV